MEAAHITWRPLGRLLVEQGLLTADDLERALAEQQVTGQRLGETIVKLGFVSGPELANALAAQYGIELTTETGFGTGLRSQIQRRHESGRERVVHLVPDPVHETTPLHVVKPDAAEPVLEPEPAVGDTPLLAQLEEQWAKLAAAEETLAERERELAELGTSRQQELADLVESRDRALTESVERERELRELAESRERELAERAERAEDLAERERELRELAEGRERELAERAERERELTERPESHERELAQLAESTRELSDLVESRDRALAESAEREREVGEWAESRERELAELAERHNGDLRQVEALNERLRAELEELRVAAESDVPVPIAPTSHLVFVQLGERYELISRDGPPPAQSTTLTLPDVDEGMFVVAGRRSSPLPGDGRPCVFVHRG